MQKTFTNASEFPGSLAGRTVAPKQGQERCSEDRFIVTEDDEYGSSRIISYIGRSGREISGNAERFFVIRR